ncbi:MAG: acyltransferase [Planctomycetes bacterium]|nr:acyltransferase [Planctomycetota bacterium]
MVALYHAGMQVEGVSTAPSGPFRFGYVGVSFFYVLSGFVLAWTWRRGEPVRFFYLRRFARVWPLHALMTIVAGCLFALGVRGTAEMSALPAHLLLVQAWVFDNAFIFQWNGVSWSLSNEAFFYAVFPLLVVAFIHRPRLLAALGLTWLVVTGTVLLLTAPNLTMYLYTFPGHRVGEFAVGIGCGLWVRSGRQIPVTLNIGVLVAAFCYALIWIGDRLTDGFFGREIWASHLLVLGGFAVAVMAAAQHDLSGRGSWLGLRPLVKLGQWSFALYLVHALTYQTGNPLLGGRSYGGRYAVVLGLLLIAITVSGLLYEAFERPVEARIRARARLRQSELARATTPGRIP